jgi:hypothetical protein
MRNVKGVITGSHWYYYELNRRIFDTSCWWFKVDGQVIKNPVRPYVADLDLLPLRIETDLRQRSYLPP